MNLDKYALHTDWVSQSFMTQTALAEKLVGSVKAVKAKLVCSDTVRTQIYIYLVHIAWSLMVFKDSIF